MAEMHHALNNAPPPPPGVILSVTHESLQELERNSAPGTLGYTGVFIVCHSCHHVEFNIIGVPYRFPVECPQCNALDMWIDMDQWNQKTIEDHNESDPLY